MCSSDLTVASTRKGPARGMADAVYPVEATVGSVARVRFAAIVVIGGDGAGSLWDDPSVHGALRCHLADGAVVSGICFGVVALARAGVLAGRRATVYPDRRAELELSRGGAVLTGDSLAEDGPIVTARGPAEAVLLAHSLLARLGA